jgi:aquaporin Z
MNNLVVEFLGTAFLIFIVLALGEPMAIGIALTVAMLIGGHISGGHFNPAVSVVMAMSGKLSMKNLAPYVLAQIFGGLSALELFRRV